MTLPALESLAVDAPWARLRPAIARDFTGEVFVSIVVETSSRERALVGGPCHDGGEKVPCCRALIFVAYYHDLIPLLDSGLQASTSTELDGCECSLNIVLGMS